MKYKAGDKVRIKSLDWYNENKDEKNRVNGSVFVFLEEMKKFCGKTLTINEVYRNHYTTKETKYVWTDEMIEGLVEDTNELDAKAFSDGYDQGYDDGQYDISEWNLPDGYQFVDENGNVINATKIVLEKKKEYPKTYDECCEVLGVFRKAVYDEEEWQPISPEFECKLDSKLSKLRELLICRDTYWKIAGEEMGLGKPWKPDWQDAAERKYCIVNTEGDITKWVQKTTNKVLAFPTEEMRDAFYENFKELIEICKELL